MKANYRYTTPEGDSKKVFIDHTTGNIFDGESGLPLSKINNLRWSNTDFTPLTPDKSPAKTPTEKQVGGSHYKDFEIQPSVYIRVNGIGWYEGNAIKYISRHKAKGGKQDLEKAIHYLELALEEYK